MNESTNINNGNNSMESEKPVRDLLDSDTKFPPFPEPDYDDFEEDITQEERDHYKMKFKDLNKIIEHRLHCTACDRHLGCSPRNEARIRPHPMLRTLMCHTCHTFYNSGEFEKGDDGSELYCRWCGQGGQVYCCSACPHVFCAKCIKRNLGPLMIKEIEDTDDWKCFKCNSKYLWDLRAVCWAVLRYCDLKNKITYKTEDPALKEVYQKECALDLSDCCRSKYRRMTEKKGSEKKKEKQREEKQKEKEEKKNVSPIVKPSTIIQVKKFASISAEDRINKIDKKTQKRPASPKNTASLKNTVTYGPNNMINSVAMPSMPKKVRMPNSILINPVRFNNKSPVTYTRIRPKPPQIRHMIYNGFNTNPFNDNINLSIESLTQGLDMSSVAGMGNNIRGLGNNSQDDVVCTPDFPLEPLCEVTEDNNDDDVQCMGPVVAPKPPPLAPPLLVPRNANTLPTLSSDNIIQMTENDVTVNAATGGLKFRVDPQTLSANKMYRLPDGRIFAINSNPNMPGGYSATIVAVTDESFPKMPPKGATYAAKLSSVGSPMLSPPPLKSYRNQDTSSKSKRNNTAKTSKHKKKKAAPTRDCDVNVPVEWYRYNLIDAVDSLEYSLSKLNKLKQEATTMFLRTRSVSEMRTLHKRLERLLNTSSCRFNEIRDCINKEMNQYLSKKLAGNTSEDDDDVEILHDDNDDPIFIDENSVDSMPNESQEVDLTVLGSDHNESGEKSEDKNDGVQIVESLCDSTHQDSDNENNSLLPDNSTLHDQSSQSNISTLQDKSISVENSEKSDKSEHPEECILPDNPVVVVSTTLPVIPNIDDSLQESPRKDSEKESVDVNNTNVDQEDQTGDHEITKEKQTDNTEIKDSDEHQEEDMGNDINDETSKSIDHNHETEAAEEDKIDEELLKDDISDQVHTGKKNDDTEINEDVIDNLLNDDPGDNIERQNLTPMDISA